MIYSIFLLCVPFACRAFFRLFPQFLAHKRHTVGDIKLTKMSIIITSKKSRNQQKIWYTFEWGKEPDQRKAAGIFTYVKPKDTIQKNFNKEALALLKNKKAQLTIERQE